MDNTNSTDKVATQTPADSAIREQVSSLLTGSDKFALHYSSSNQTSEAEKYLPTIKMDNKDDHDRLFYPEGPQVIRDPRYQFDVQPMDKDKVDKAAEKIADGLLKEKGSFGSQEMRDLFLSAAKGGELDELMDSINKSLKEHGSDLRVDGSESSTGGMGTSFVGPVWIPDLYHNLDVELRDNGRLVNKTNTEWGGQDPRIMY